MMITNIKMHEVYEVTAHIDSKLWFITTISNQIEQNMYNEANVDTLLYWDNYKSTDFVEQILWSNMTVIELLEPYLQIYGSILWLYITVS